MDRLHLLSGAACLLAAVACAAPVPSAGAGPQVMGWVPADGIASAEQAFEAHPQIGQTLTRIGLQFWNPAPDGRRLVLAPVDPHGKPVSPRTVERLVRWARSHGVQPLLTVYNNSAVLDRWDWALARRAFAGHPQEFTAALVSAVEQWHLDGVDLDLEAEGEHEADRAAFSAFVHRLSEALKAHHKLLTVDTAHSPCDNAPNMRWWPDWTGQVQAIHSMGSTDLYEGNDDSFRPEGRPLCEHGAALFRYSWQIDYGLRAGYRREQILMGLPTWVDAWGAGGQGPTVLDHLRELRALGVGAALWDLQLQAPGWHRVATWEGLQALRHPWSGLAHAGHAGHGGTPADSGAPTDPGATATTGVTGPAARGRAVFARPVSVER